MSMAEEGEGRSEAVEEQPSGEAPAPEGPAGAVPGMEDLGEEEQALLREMQGQLAQMFIRDEKHVNCPVAGVTKFPDNTLEITFQVGHNHFHSYRIGQPGQKAIVDNAQLSDLVIADGPLPPMPEGGMPGMGHPPGR